MNEAVNDDLLAKNPCNKISIPRPAIVHERRSMSPEEAARLRRILMSGEPTANTFAVTLALATGMRRGEVMGLMWKNVDLAGSQLYVEYQYASDRALRAPKSKKSVRWLSLDGGTVERLARWKELQPVLYPVEIGEDSPVVTDELGGFYDPTNFSRWFRGFCVANGFGRYEKQESWRDEQGAKRYRKAKYDGLQFHELRHTQATLLIGSGADIKTAQHRLGHSTAALTMDIYSHALPVNDRKAADVIGRILEAEPENESASV